MGAHIPRERTIAALDEIWTSLLDLLPSLGDEAWHRPTPLPGWDVHDVVAHVAGTEAMLLGEPTPAVAVDRAANPHVRNDIGALNEAWVASMRPLAPAELIGRLAGVTAARLDVLRRLTDDEWEADSPTPAGPATYGRFMQIRAFDCWLHEQDVRDAVGVRGNESGLGMEVTIDELANALGFVVGKKAAVGPGRSVTFALTDGGAVVRWLHVRVGERAEVVAGLDGPADVTLTMPTGVLTRLAAGRVDPAAVAGEIDVAGDSAIADAVLGNLAYTI